MEKTTQKSFILIFLLTLMLTACGNSTKVPEGFSPEMYAYGQDVIEITQKFIDGKNNQNSAYQQIVEIEKKVATLEENQAAENDHKISFCVSKLAECVGNNNTPELIAYLDALENIMNNPEANAEPTFSEQLVGGWKYQYNNGLEGYWVFNADGTGYAKLYDGLKLKHEFSFSYSVDEENQIIHQVGKDGTVYKDPWITVTDFTGDSFYSTLYTHERTEPEANDGLCTRVK